MAVAEKGRAEASSKGHAASGAQGRASNPPSEVGTVLAQRYEIVRELGRGGMGVVYLCRDLVTDERVALKRLRSPEDASGPMRPEETWWFQQEARAVAALDHPTLVRARDFGTLADGSPYLVMDALPGRSVHEWMHTTKLSWTLIWSLVNQVLAGLAHVHARGVIHGDMKPSNVMLDLASGGRGPRAYILDLGLAWLRQARHDPRLDGAPIPERAVHAGAGTVGWVAPEQIRKAATYVGPPTNLYALGCIIYRIASGKEMFEGAAQDVLRAHKRNPVPPMTLTEDFPPELEPYVQRLLAKRPWHRFDWPRTHGAPGCSCGRQTRSPSRRLSRGRARRRVERSSERSLRAKRSRPGCSPCGCRRWSAGTPSGRRCWKL